MIKNEQYTVDNFTTSIIELSKYFNIEPSNTRNRLKLCWSINDAVKLKPREKNKQYKVDEFISSIQDISKHFKININTLKSRLKFGYSIEDSIKLKLKK